MEGNRDGLDCVITVFTPSVKLCLLYHSNHNHVMFACIRQAR